MRHLRTLVVGVMAALLDSACSTESPQVPVASPTAPGGPSAPLPMMGTPMSPIASGTAGSAVPTAPDAQGVMQPGAMQPGVPGPTPIAGETPGSTAAGPRPFPEFAWTMFNFDYDNSRNNRFETVLAPDNVSRLMEKWAFEDVLGGVTSTPIVVNGAVYFTSHGRQNRDSPDNIPGSMYALDAQTGQLLWKKDQQFVVRASTPLVVGDVVYAGGGSTVYAWDRHEGSELWKADISMGEMWPMIDSSPQLVGDKIIIGLASYEVIFSSQGNYTGRGAVVALNAMDGTEVWRRWTAGEGGMGAGNSVWSSIAYDPVRDRIFVGTGQAYEQPAGPYTDALLALDPNTGEVMWAHQYHPGDVYIDGRGGMDYDIGAAPNLFQAMGKDVVGAGSKGGLFKALDRDTGEPVWERSVGSGSALGGVMSVAAYADGVIYLSNTQGSGAITRALDAETGMDIWTKSMPAATWGALTIANRVLYQPCRNGRLYALDISNGNTLWEASVLYDMAGGVSVSDGVIYAPAGFTGLGASRGARLTAFSLDGTGMIHTDDGGSGVGCENVCELLRTSCGGSRCHSETDSAAMLDLESVAFPSKLASAPATTAACQGETLLNPANLDQSLLYTKLIDPVKCGPSMPPGSPLPAEQIACIRQWLGDPRCAP